MEGCTDISDVDAWAAAACWSGGQFYLHGSGSLCSFSMLGSDCLLNHCYLSCRESHLSGRTPAWGNSRGWLPSLSDRALLCCGCHSSG